MATGGSASCSQKGDGWPDVVPMTTAIIAAFRIDMFLPYLGGRALRPCWSFLKAAAGGGARREACENSPAAASCTLTVLRKGD